MSNENLHKEIDLIQDCIRRMAQNSFIVKGWILSLITIVITLGLTKDFTDKVFLEIGKISDLNERYNALISEGRARGYKNSIMTINQFIGQHVKIFWGLNNFGIYAKPKSKLIKHYTIH
ncbi:MAG: hypothetical protein U9P73_06320 [Candidatus Cloacimonadota bacterium]|nr:hypothetical protein [Candidatus Cloacimonadota bacterium]